MIQLKKHILWGYLLFGISTVVTSCVITGSIENGKIEVAFNGYKPAYFPEGLMTDFRCQSKSLYYDILTRDSFVVIKVEDIKECFFNDNLYIIHFLNPECSRIDVASFDFVKELTQKYPINDYVIISIDYYNYKEVKELEKAIQIPIFFIEHGYNHNSRRNYFCFLSELLGKDIRDVKALKTCMVMHKDNVLYSFYGAWDYNEADFEKKLKELGLL